MDRKPPKCARPLGSPRLRYLLWQLCFLQWPLSATLYRLLRSSGRPPPLPTNLLPIHKTGPAKSPRRVLFVIVLFAGGTHHASFGASPLVTNALGRFPILWWAAQTFGSPRFLSAWNPIIGAGFRSFWNANVEKVCGQPSPAIGTSPKARFLGAQTAYNRGLLGSRLGWALWA